MKASSINAIVVLTNCMISVKYVKNSPISFAMSFVQMSHYYHLSETY